MTEAEKQMLN